MSQGKGRQECMMDRRRVRLNRMTNVTENKWNYVTPAAFDHDLGLSSSRYKASRRVYTSNGTRSAGVQSTCMHRGMSWPDNLPRQYLLQFSSDILPVFFLPLRRGITVNIDNRTSLSVFRVHRGNMIISLGKTINSRGRAMLWSSAARKLSDLTGEILHSYTIQMLNSSFRCSGSSSHSIFSGVSEDNKLAGLPFNAPRRICPQIAGRPPADVSYTLIDASLRCLNYDVKPLDVYKSCCEELGTSFHSDENFGERYPEQRINGIHTVSSLFGSAMHAAQVRAVRAMESEAPLNAS
ncbi:hypothetical protein EVAR_59724_1 [Eumeta japonica]|uniref:Uncharacterized protein n=1 Tax=Eumeta variegata TaxID=151549 RepID=A0A4C1XLR1_EUMVA|nr:hypothetical protein EVAR_59724_1 [Eumeta japonica]